MKRYVVCFVAALALILGGEIMLVVFPLEPFTLAWLRVHAAIFMLVGAGRVWAQCWKP